MRKIIIPVLLSAMFFPGVSASGEGTSSAQFLKIDASARAAAMGGAYAGFYGDASSLFYNPAGITGSVRNDLYFTHIEWMEGIKSDYIGYVQPLDNLWSLGFSGSLLRSGEMDRIDNSGNLSGGTFTDNSLQLGLTVARRAGRFRFGATGKYIREALDSRQASAFAGDIGAGMTYGRFNFGWSLQNAGSSMKLYQESFQLPVTNRIGATYNVMTNLVFAADFVKPRDASGNVRLGAEYALPVMGTKIALRGGYQTGTAEEMGAGVGGGLGLEFSSFRADFSISPCGEFGNVTRISAGLRFGDSIQIVESEDEEEEAPRPKKKAVAVEKSAPAPVKSLKPARTAPVSSLRRASSDSSAGFIR